MSLVRLVSLLTFTLLWIFTISKPCMAQTKDGITHLRIGIIARANKKYRLEQVEPFRAFMEQQIALPVSLVPFEGYEDLIKAHHDRRIHYAIYSATAYAQSWAACRCLEPLAAPRAEDGSY